MRLPVSFNYRQSQLYRSFMFCPTKRLWLLRHCQIQCTTIGNIGEFDASGLALLAIDEFRRLHVDVLFAVVLGCDNKLLAFEIVGIEFDGHLVENGTADRKFRFRRGKSIYSKESDACQDVP